MFSLTIIKHRTVKGKGGMSKRGNARQETCLVNDHDERIIEGKYVCVQEM